MFLLVLSFSFACNRRVAELTGKSIPPAPVTAGSQSNSSPANTFQNLPRQTNTPVNAVDFENFAFPVCPKILNDEALPRLKSIKLKDGKLVEKEKVPSSDIEHDIIFYLTNVSYYDLTNDNHLDAVVTPGIQYFQGRDHCTFVYSLKNKTPKLLLTHEYKNGIRKISFEQGGLLIEDYNDDGAVCCPKTYSRFLFNWNGNRFIETKSERIPYEKEVKESLSFPDN